MPKILIPSIKKEGPPPPSDRDILYGLILHSPWQQRKAMYRNPLLDLAAQNKASDMTARRYYSHTSPDGVSANKNVRSTGYLLPDWFPADGNNCESWSLNYNNTIEEAMGRAIQMWYDSTVHRAHVYGYSDFFKSQECCGVGTSLTFDGSHVFVFLSAPCY